MITRIDGKIVKMDKNSGKHTLVSALSKIGKLSKGTMLGNVEDELTCRKLKFPKRGFCDSIPRKLRSAISKRSCKTALSPLLDSKRIKHSINGVPSIRKKSKTSVDGCSDSLPISKEEEEVAETLFALAGMVSVNGESSEDKTPGLTRNDNNDDPMCSSEDQVFRKEDQGTACNQLESSKRISLSCPKLSERRRLNKDLKVSIPPTHLQSIPPLLKTCDAKQHSVDPQAVESVANQERNRFREVGVDGLQIKSSAIVFPSWISASASSSRPTTCGDSVSVDKVLSCVNGTMKPRKRCITHVHISHLIQRIQKSEGKDSRPLDAYQLQPFQFSSIAPRNSDLSGAFTSHMFSSATYKNDCETGNKIPMNLELNRNKDDSSKKQGFDFLSLSTRVGSNTNANIGANCLEAKGSTYLPCSTPQRLFSSKAHWDQVAVASMAVPPRPPQVQLQMPQFYASTFNPAHSSHTGLAQPSQLAQPKSQHEQYQIWSSQLATQFRSGPLFATHIANWQAQRQDPRLSHLLPSQPSLNSTIGAKFLHVSQQQPQLIGCYPPLPHPSAKPQTGQLQSDGALPFQLLCNERP